ncbi:MAG: High-affinity nickel-transporter, partial [Chloroflexota bacterium]|nr:High-affinity nickel-transporter [Chloroflexota bacterium]
ARVVSSSVPATDRSNELRAYPQDALTSPLDVRTAQVTVAAAGVGGVAQLGSSSGLARRGNDDPLASLLGGELSPGVVLLAVLLAAGLGAAHAVSPGHGKTLVAAYLVGSSGGRRHAATLGLTVAAAHTAGVFLLGAITLAAGALFVPERVIAWLSLASGVLVIGLGAGLLVRAAGGRRGIDAAGHVHAEAHAHEHTGPHGHPHPHGHAHHNLATEAGRDSQLDHAAPLRRRNVIALGLAGGLVPSASALIVLLVAVSSGRLVFGLTLILAFGAGMALVLAGLAVATTFLRGTLARHSGPSASPLARRAAAALPLASGLTVLVAGLVLTIGAAGRVG